MKKLIIFLGFLVMIVFSSTTNLYSHSGRTNGDGCHNDYINGGYHCHDGSSSNDGSSSGNWDYNETTSNNDSSIDSSILSIVLISFLGIIVGTYFYNRNKKK